MEKNSVSSILLEDTSREHLVTSYVDFSLLMALPLKNLYSKPRPMFSNEIMRDVINFNV
jgi:hypothetical protein